MSGMAFGTGLILFYFLFYFSLLLISNFRGSKKRGSMDPVHILMDPVHGPGMFCVLSRIKLLNQTTKLLNLLIDLLRHFP